MLGLKVNSVLLWHRANSRPDYSRPVPPQLRYPMQTCSTLWHSAEQQSASDVQGAPIGRQLKAAAEVGARTELTSGAAKPAAAARRASFFTICRLDGSAGASRSELSTSRRRRKRSTPTL